jgi:ATP-binding cassette subfamily B protein
MKSTRDFTLIWSKIADKKKVYFGVAATLIVSGISAVVPYLYGRLVDLSITSKSATIIFVIIALWAIISILRDVIERYSVKVAYEIGIDIFTRFHVDVVRHIMDLPLQYHKEKKVGEVAEKIDRGIEDIYALIENSIFSFFPTAITFLAAMIILLFVEWRLTIILIAASIAHIFITLAYTKQTEKPQEMLNNAWTIAFGARHDALFNIESVKSTINEELEYKKNAANFDEANRAYRAHRSLWLKMDQWQSTIFTLSFIAVFSLGVFMLRTDSLTPGALIMFVGYISLLTAPLSRIADQYRRIKGALVSFKRMSDFFNIAPERDSPYAKEIYGVRGSVVFKNVSFGYKNEKEILNNISFEITAGETVALIGKSGVGKTTLTNLIGRYYLPNNGKIYIDNVDINEIKLKSLRNNIAVVPQEVLLFNDTIKNNIAYSRPDAKESEIVEAATTANAHEFIESFEKRYDQLVGERGVKLSTGQKQRIAVARAILKNPKILILDEATSALDSVSERLVREALERVIKDRTTFIIAHRLSTIKHADKIIVLENGTIVEMGNHNELMGIAEGVYKNFWALQSIGDHQQ